MATKVFSILGDMIDTDEKRAEVNDKIISMDFESYYDPLPILKEVEKWDTPQEKITDYERDFIKNQKVCFKQFKKDLFWINNNRWDRPKYTLKSIIDWCSSEMVDIQGGNKEEAEKLVKEFRKEYKRDYIGSKKFDKENYKKLKNAIYDFYFNTRGYNRNNWIKK